MPTQGALNPSSHPPREGRAQADAMLPPPPPVCSCSPGCEKDVWGQLKLSQGRGHGLRKDGKGGGRYPESQLQWDINNINKGQFLKNP